MSPNSRFYFIGLLIFIPLITGCSAQNTVDSFGSQLFPLENNQMLGSGAQIFLLVTVISLAPALLISITAFTRIIIVLSFLRNAIAAPQIPPNQVLVGLALFLTFFIMMPTWTEVNHQALQPYLNGQIDEESAYRLGIAPIRQFLFKHTRERDLALFVHLADIPRPGDRDDVPTYILVPAFIISELKTAFQMGVFIFVPFLVIDMIVASALMSMGMMMLPPTIFSLPFKLLLFVMADGWHLLIRSLVASF
jgi:flagellar biosynthetic protein FliP